MTFRMQIEWYMRSRTRARRSFRSDCGREPSRREQETVFHPSESFSAKTTCLAPRPPPIPKYPSLIIEQIFKETSSWRQTAC